MLVQFPHVEQMGRILTVDEVAKVHIAHDRQLYEKIQSDMMMGQLVLWADWRDALLEVALCLE